MSKVLIVGSGGREHAICWKLSQSNEVLIIYLLSYFYSYMNFNLSFVNIIYLSLNVTIFLKVKNIYVVPGNPGIASENKVSLIKLDVNENKVN